MSRLSAVTVQAVGEGEGGGGGVRDSRSCTLPLVVVATVYQQLARFLTTMPHPGTKGTEKLFTQKKEERKGIRKEERKERQKKEREKERKKEERNEGKKDRKKKRKKD